MKTLLILFLSFITTQIFAQSNEAYLLRNELKLMYGSDPHFQIKISKDLNTLSSTDAFAWHCKGKTIEIFGTTQSSYQYAVYHFLETMFNYHYLTADAVERPSLHPIVSEDKSITQFRNKQKLLLLQYQKKGFPDRKVLEKPAFVYREIFYGEGKRGNYAAFNGLTIPDTGISEKHTGWGLWVHTLHRLLPPNIWFNTHPEYFALRNGIRMKDQLCLSNEGAVQEVIANLRKEIQKNPEAKYWSVSQMDNYNYCECEKCSGIDKEEASHSGSMIRFVNKVAKAFPDKIISTLAYQYTRSAPKIIRPEPNVNIMLCTIESNRSKPIKGTDFESDLANWSKLTHNILIWDYVINFSHLVAPFPNWQVLTPNLQLFKSYGVNMVFEQGFNQVSAEQEPLRAFLLSKLLWNPYLNSDNLMKSFLDLYYGEAGSIVYDIIKTQTNALNASGFQLTLYEPPAAHLKGFLSDSLFRVYGELMDEAMNKSKNNVQIQQRLQMLMQSFRYAALECYKFSRAGTHWIFAEDLHHNRQNPENHGPFKNGTTFRNVLDTFTAYAKKYGPFILHESRLSPDEYYQRTTDFWNNAVCSHKALNKAIHYVQAPDNAYLDGSIIRKEKWQQNQSIVNGLRGGLDYQFNWMGWWGCSAEFIIDLGKIDTVSKLNLHFFENNLAWIVGPQSITLEAVRLTNDTNYQVIKSAYVQNPDVGKKMNEGVYPLTVQFDSPAVSRYFKVKILNPGKLPEWRGVNDNGWLFIDEVELY